MNFIFPFRLILLNIFILEIVKCVKDGNEEDNGNKLSPKSINDKDKMETMIPIEKKISKPNHQKIKNDVVKERTEELKNTQINEILKEMEKVKKLTNPLNPNEKDHVIKSFVKHREAYTNKWLKENRNRADKDKVNELMEHLTKGNKDFIKTLPKSILERLGENNLERATIPNVENGMLFDNNVFAHKYENIIEKTLNSGKSQIDENYFGESSSQNENIVNHHTAFLFADNIDEHKDEDPLLLELMREYEEALSENTQQAPHHSVHNSDNKMKDTVIRGNNR
uniref:DUF148 domain-containing protein n=1 Tax=Meloidogyne hapla TaxID=6305 RepID=A0A1I8BBT1_MELHA